MLKKQPTFYFPFNASSILYYLRMLQCLLIHRKIRVSLASIEPLSRFIWLKKPVKKSNFATICRHLTNQQVHGFFFFKDADFIS